MEECDNCKPVPSSPGSARSVEYIYRSNRGTRTHHPTATQKRERRISTNVHSEAAAQGVTHFRHSLFGVTLRCFGRALTTHHTGSGLSASAGTGTSHHLTTICVTERFLIALTTTTARFTTGGWCFRFRRPNHIHHITSSHHHHIVSVLYRGSTVQCSTVCGYVLSRFGLSRSGCGRLRCGFGLRWRCRSGLSSRCLFFPRPVPLH